jgi:hypothetical protein
MRFKSMTTRLIVLGVACTGLGTLAVWATEEKDEGSEMKMTLEQMSAPVRAVIEEHTKGRLRSMDRP